MAELIERYVHRVGQYLPKQDRADIEAELRSLIHDQLDDRYAGTPTPEEVAAVLTELGAPRQVAAGYTREQYLVGPDLYPTLMWALRRVWVVVPAVMIALGIFEGLAETRIGVEWLVETLLSLVQTTFTVSAVVVLIFAIMQRVNLDQEMPFNPLELPKVDDPRTVNRLESVVGIALAIVFTLLLLYYLYVGGLTLRFNLTDPGDVLPVPTAWLIVLIINTLAIIGIMLIVLRRTRWNVTLWTLETLIEVLSAIGLYFVLFQPLLGARLPGVPELIAIVSIGSTLVSRGSKLVTLWNYR